jgi:hypothetical protein
LERGGRAPIYAIVAGHAKTIAIDPSLWELAGSGGMRLVLRILGTWLIGMAVILIVIDGTKSLGANAIVTTSLNDTWTALNAQSLAALRAFIDSRFFGPVLEPLLTGLLGAPGWIVLGVPGILLAIAGRSRSVRQFVHQDQF